MERAVGYGILFGTLLFITLLIVILRRNTKKRPPAVSQPEGPPAHLFGLVIALWIRESDGTQTILQTYLEARLNSASGIPLNVFPEAIESFHRYSLWPERICETRPDLIVTGELKIMTIRDEDGADTGRIAYLLSVELYWGAALISSHTFISREESASIAESIALQELARDLTKVIMRLRQSQMGRQSEGV